MGTHIIESAVGFFFFFLEIQNAILTCIPHHTRFYAPLGFQEAAGTQSQYQPHLDCELVCLHGQESRVPSPMRDRVVAFAARIERNGATCRCPAFPACVPGPYSTGRFEGIDLFCPVRAAEILAKTV